MSCAVRRAVTFLAALGFCLPPQLRGDAPPGSDGARIAQSGAIEPAAEIALAWQGVSAGALSARPVSVMYEGRQRLALVTEDRWIRLYDEMGGVVAALRTGVRFPLQPHPLHDGVIELALPDGTVRRYSAGIGEHGAPLAGRRPPLAADARAWAPDPHGNAWFLPAGRRALYVSAAGTVLGSINLPDAVAAAVAAEEGMWLALGDGRVVLLGGGGTVQEVMRAERPITTLALGWNGSRRRIVTIDERGTTVLAELDRGRSRERARANLSPGSDVAVCAGDGGAWMIDARDGSVVRLDGGGVRRFGVGREGSRAVELVAIPDRGSVAVLDAAHRVTLLSDAGATGERVALPAAPQGIRAVAGQLVAWYPDWRIDVIALPFAVARIPPARAPFIPPRRDGAFAAYVAAVLGGGTAQERDGLLDSIALRIEERRLAGHLETTHLAIRTLLTEVYRTPATGGAARPAVDLPAVRLQAVALLGRILDTPARALLAEVVARDPDPTVAAHALDALAGIGTDPGRALAAAVRRFEQEGRRTREQFAPSIVAMLEANPPIGAALREQAAVAVIRADVPRELRQRAAAALRRAGGAIPAEIR